MGCLPPVCRVQGGGIAVARTLQSRRSARAAIGARRGRQLRCPVPTARTRRMWAKRIAIHAWLDLIVTMTIADVFLIVLKGTGVMPEFNTRSRVQRAVMGRQRIWWPKRSVPSALRGSTARRPGHRPYRCVRLARSAPRVPRSRVFAQMRITALRARPPRCRARPGSTVPPRGWWRPPGCAQQATSARAGLRPQRRPEAMGWTATSVRLAITVWRAVLSLHHAPPASFRRLQGMWGPTTVETARRGCIAKALAALRPRARVLRDTTALVASQLQPRPPISVIQDTTVRLVVQCRRCALRASTSLLPGVRIVCCVRRGSIFTRSAAMRCRTASTASRASTSRRLAAARQATALIAWLASTFPYLGVTARWIASTALRASTLLEQRTRLLAIASPARLESMLMYPGAAN